ncbi:hypothetical protein M0813_29831 [Anaeramoeba flamelloides]|uniref:Uncharacterized protein n=1 Tax=Anaeramoeba flamelloides TaxID=1746091 RepID=A0ABQ8XN46_9EUKA|nr:hypothetical protein M0813_29831 [Anaeramoeba flamelloides]
MAYSPIQEEWTPPILPSYEQQSLLELNSFQTASFTNLFAPLLQMQANERKRKEFEKMNIEKQTNEATEKMQELGKDLFKLMIGLLWVISGGGSQMTLSPYTDQFLPRIELLLNVGTNTLSSASPLLKHLLSNSRRGFTEFVLEMIVAVLSLRHLEDEELKENNDLYKTAIKLDKVLKMIVLLNKQENMKKSKPKTTKRTTNCLNKDPENRIDPDEIKKKLEKIYCEIYHPKVLMFWFEKRFVYNTSLFLTREDKINFFREHFFFLGKSKFVLCILIIANELANNPSITKQYFQLIQNMDNSSPLGLYQNNRMKKLKLIQDLIIKFSLNSGNYWELISQDYVQKMKFQPSNMFLNPPFSNLVNNPNIQKIILQKTINLKKKRIVKTNHFYK